MAKRHIRRNKLKDFDEARFHDYDVRFRINEDKLPGVRAFNTLSADDRAIYIAYLVMGENKTSLARHFGVSWAKVYERIRLIEDEVRERSKKMADEE